ncbi:acyl-CoA dehydrogenase, C-terminal domain protein [Mycobacterium xenopi 3993]|nr:acyl-CoA dehydrogenase, C-terminal domain protein [Mycobacterium xenopi 3993]
MPVSGAMGTVSVGVVDADRLTASRLDTFDGSVCWWHVSGALDGELIEASTEWNRAISAAHRALATELVAVADRALRLAVDHISARVQFGMPIGSFQSPRHALADAAATLAAPGRCWVRPGAMAGGCRHRPPRRRPDGRTERWPTPRFRCAAPSG